MLKPQERDLCFGGASFAGGHSQEEVLHAPPQHCVLSNLPQASVQLFHLLVFTFDVYGGAESRQRELGSFSEMSQENKSPENHIVTGPLVPEYEIWNGAQRSDHPIDLFYK